MGVGGRNVFRSDVFKVNTPAKPIEVDLQGARAFVLEVGDAGDGIGWDQADWADAQVELADGKTLWLGDLPILDDQLGLFSADPPFSFTYNGKPSAEFLGTWKVDRKTKKLDDHRTAHTITYSDPAGGLSVRCEAIAYDDFPMVEWTLHFKNTGAADTPIIENIQSLDVLWQRGGQSEYLLHHNIGAPADGTDYTPLETVLAGGKTKRISAAGGRSTQTDMSYFNLERSKDDGLIVVVGWPGQWAADFIRDVDTGADPRRPGIDAFHAASERRSSHAAFGAPVLEGRRLDSRAKRLAALDDRPQHAAARRQGAAADALGLSRRRLRRNVQGERSGPFRMVRPLYGREYPVDYWWMDAGWYPCDPVGWPKVGTWEVDKRAFRAV